MVMWRVSRNEKEDLNVDEFLYCYELSQISAFLGFWTFKNRDRETKIIQRLPSSSHEWKDSYVFVCGDN